MALWVGNFRVYSKVLLLNHLFISLDVKDLKIIWSKIQETMMLEDLRSLLTIKSKIAFYPIGKIIVPRRTVYSGKNFMYHCWKTKFLPKKKNLSLSAGKLSLEKKSLRFWIVSGVDPKIYKSFGGKNLALCLRFPPIKSQVYFLF